MPARDLPRLSQPPRDPAFVANPYGFYDRARALGLSGLAVACYLGLLAFAVADWRLTTHEPTGG